MQVTQPTQKILVTKEKKWRREGAAQTFLLSASSCEAILSQCSLVCCRNSAGVQLASSGSTTSIASPIFCRALSILTSLISFICNISQRTSFRDGQASVAGEASVARTSVSGRQVSVVRTSVSGADKRQWRGQVSGADKSISRWLSIVENSQK